MDLEKRSDGYWITGVPDGPDCGPYDRKADAAADRRGMIRFFRYEDDPGFFTADREATPRVAAHATTGAAGSADAVECVT